MPSRLPEILLPGQPSPLRRDPEPCAPLAGNRVQWHTEPMHTKAMVLALATLASTGFGPAASPQSAAASTAAKVVVYKSPT